MIKWKRRLPYGGQERAGVVCEPAEGVATITISRPAVRRPDLAGFPWRP